VDHLQHVLGEPRKLRVQLQVDTRRQEREALEQPLDIRIGALERLEPEAARDLGVLAGELSAQLTDVLKLAPVVLQQPRIHLRTRSHSVAHRTCPRSETLTPPFSRSI